MGVLILLILFYGLLWFSSLFMLLSTDKYINRAYQLFHSFYLILFTWLVFEFEIGDSPFVLLVILQFAAAMFFAYRFVKSKKESLKTEEVSFSEQLTPQGKKHLQDYKRTVNQLFNHTNQQKHKS